MYSTLTMYNVHTTYTAAVLYGNITSEIVDVL